MGTPASLVTRCLYSEDVGSLCSSHVWDYVVTLSHHSSLNQGSCPSTGISLHTPPSPAASALVSVSGAQLLWILHENL